MRLPWNNQDVPHAILDILRGCNIRCRDCYNLLPDQVKSLDEIDTQLDTLMRLRRLHSVSIVGGEVTLHPDLVEIVRRVRHRGLFAELFSNGVDLNTSMLARLRGAGANVIFLHIEPYQRRPDLAANANAEDVRRLRAEKAALVAQHGIEVGLAITVYPDRPNELEEAIEFVLSSPHVAYLLVTFWRDVGRMPTLYGSLEEGIAAQSVTGGNSNKSEAHSPTTLYAFVNKRFGLTPFAFLGSNVDANDPRWVSFMAATVRRAQRETTRSAMHPTWIERGFLAVYRRLTGRYPFYQPPRQIQQLVHLALNGIAGGGFIKNLRTLTQALRPGAALSVKRLLFQWPASIDADGRVIHCQGCPDAVTKSGGLVPLCISDRVTQPKPPAEVLAK
jgi:pyruvate-formate lyase-activating enzyme